MRGRAGAVIGYPLMPERFATNIDLSGQVSRWVEKTPLTAAFPALTVMFLDACFAFSHWSILRSKKGIDAARPAASAWAIIIGFTAVTVGFIVFSLCM